jgi:hypothetical protein
MPSVERAAHGVVHGADRVGSRCGMGWLEMRRRGRAVGATGSASMKNRGGARTTWAGMGRLAGLLWQVGHEGFQPKAEERKVKLP